MKALILDLQHAWFLIMSLPHIVEGSYVLPFSLCF